MAFASAWRALQRLTPLWAAFTAAYALAGCKALEGGLPGSDEKRYVGSYRTTWGPVVLRDGGDELEGVYRRGQLRCVPEDKRLHCVWTQGQASGQATLRRRDDGVLEGSWGRGESDSDGGAWLWAPDERR